MKLYTHELSGHSHRVRLLASLLNLQPENVAVNLLGGAHKQPEFLALNPFGQVPVLEDGDVALFDSNAILVYLATAYDSERSWYPNDALAQAQIQIWLSKAANEVANGPAAARLVTVFKAGYDHAAVIDKAHSFLRVLEGALVGREWLVGDAPTIADVALYSYVAHAPEGGVDLAAYGNVRTWIGRVQQLPGFVAMTATATDALTALAA
ncbi:MAG: glutathione S-transferase [Halieaceae bacterium]|jgi:glutathione S-transferase